MTAVNQRTEAQIRRTVLPSLLPGESLIAIARGFPLGWTARYQLLLIPTVVLAAMTVLLLPGSPRGAATTAVIVIVAGVILFRILGKVKPVGAGDLRGNTSVVLVGTDRRFLVYTGSSRSRRLRETIELDDIDDVVLHRALVGLSRGGVVIVTGMDGRRVVAESPGLASIDDLARVVDAIR
jgi:hypothetical protein